MVNLELFTSLVDYAYEEAMDDLGGGSWAVGYFVEDGSGSGVFSRIIESIKKFFTRLIDTAVNFFKTVIEKIKGVKGVKKSGQVKIPKKYQELIDQGKISAKELNGCKSEEDLERAIKKFRKKKVAIMAGTAVGLLSVAGAVAYITKRSTVSKKELEAERVAMEKDIAAIQKEFEKESSAHAKDRAAAETASRVIGAQQKQENRENAAKHRLAQSKANAIINKGYSAQENRRLEAQGRMAESKARIERKLKFAQMQAKYKMEVAAARQNAEQTMISQIGAKLEAIGKHNEGIDYVNNTIPKTTEKIAKENLGDQGARYLNIMKDPNATQREKEIARAWLLAHGGATQKNIPKKKGGAKKQTHYKPESVLRKTLANSVHGDEDANKAVGAVANSIGRGYSQKDRILTSTHQRKY